MGDTVTRSREIWPNEGPPDIPAMTRIVERDPRAGARRTLAALVITMSALFVGSLIFMVMEGGRRIPEGRPVLAVLPFQGSTPGSSRYAGFGEGLASYFGRIDPRELGVLGPASTAGYFDPDGDPLEVGRRFEADMILMGREVSGASVTTLVAELYRVDSGTLLWSGEFDVGETEDLHPVQARIGMEVTEALNLPR